MEYNFFSTLTGIYNESLSVVYSTLFDVIFIINFSNHRAFTSIQVLYSISYLYISTTEEEFDWFTILYHLSTKFSKNNIITISIRISKRVSFYNIYLSINDNF